jgi:hypothetical protein
MPDMRILLATLLLLTMSVFQARAETSVKKYKAEIAANGADVSLTKIYILGLGDGFLWANAKMLVDKKSPLYCQPDKLVLGMENYVEILNRQIKAEATKNTQAQLDEMSLGLLLLQGLQDTFPCK